ILMGRVLDSILAQLYWYRIRTYHAEEDLQAVLAAERAGDLIADSKPILLSSAFSAAFRKRLFAIAYARLNSVLPDPKAIPEAASEVFVDYIVRLRDEPVTGQAGQEAAYCEPRHEEFLKLLCDRVAARMTGQSPDAFVRGAAQEETLPMTKVKRSGLYDAVLKEI